MRANYSPLVASVLLLGAAGAALAQSVASTSTTTSATEPNTRLAQVVVIGTTPLPGTNIDIDKVPGNVQTLSADDLAKDGQANLIGSMATQLSTVNINDTLADPFQPDILIRGFEASPVLGTPQGIAVYQNGVRINEAFGDAVNWDLILDVAFDRFDILTVTPVYGLNALGGAAVITMKNGFTYQGFEWEAAGGSFGQRGSQFQ